MVGDEPLRPEEDGVVPNGHNIDRTDETRSASAPTRFRRAELEIVTALAIAAVSVFLGLRAPSTPQMEMIDHTLFRLTVESMREGTGYYPAMNEAHEVVYGPERVVVTETVRGYRMPTTFLLWRWLPSGDAVWAAFVVMSSVTGLIAMRLVRWPPLAVLVVVYMLSIGMWREEGVWTAQFMTTELWALPAMMGAILASTKRLWAVTAALCLLAFLIRETAAPLLLAGLGLGMLGRIRRRPFMVATSLGILAYLGHVAAAMPYLDPIADTPLPTGGEIPMSVLRMIGFGIPMGLILGPALWLLAANRLRRWHPEPLLAGAVLAFPLVGLVIERDYWGLLVAPFVLLWGVDEALRLVGGGLARLRFGRGSGH